MNWDSVNYYCDDSDAFLTICKTINTDGNLLVLYMNARSCANLMTFDNIRRYLDKCDGKFDMVVISETWFKANETGLYNINGYISYHSYRAHQRGGGLSIYVKQPCNVIDVVVVSDEFNSIILELKNYKSLNKLFIYGVYRPPQSDMNAFRTSLENSLQRISTNMCLLVGDFNVNINLRSGSNGQLAHDYLNLINSNGMAVCNTNITRESSNSIIDHVCSNFATLLEHTVYTIYSAMSDHNLLVTKIKLNTNELPGVIVKKKINYDLLCDVLAQKLNNRMPITDDVNTQYNILCDIMCEGVREATTIKRIKPKKQKMCEWMDTCPKIISLIRAKKNLWKKHKHEIRQQTCSQLIIDRLRALEVKLRQAKSTAKERFYHRTFAMSNSSKEVWTAINKILTIKSTSKKSSCILLERNGVALQDEEIAEEFVQHFATIGEKLAEKIETRPNDHPNNQNTIVTNVSSIYLRPVSEFEISSLISALKTNKSPGYDDITALTVRKCSDIITPILAKITNDCFVTGVYPDKLKIARVTPIYKANEKKNVDNYRPISVLPIINNIIERALYNRIVQFLEDHNILYKYQYGFRRRSSTSYAIAETINKIQRALNDQMVATGLFMDLSKAFDTVDHTILLYKLEQIGLRGTPLNLITSYLNGRQMVVSVNGTGSTSKPITKGVPQGSILGPIMYLLYVNDLMNLRLNGELRLFADDSSSFYFAKKTNENMIRMRDDIAKITEYFRVNKLTLNLSKTQFIHFRSSRRNDVDTDNLNYNGIIIKQVQCVKYLGFRIDNHLQWHEQIDHICSRLAAAVGMLGKLKFLPTKILRMLYYAIGHSHISYGAIVWATAANIRLNRVQVLQRKALKKCHKLDLRYPTVELFRDVAKDVLPVKAIHNLQLNILVYMSLHRLALTNFDFKYSARNSEGVNGRQLLPVIPHNNYGKNCIDYLGPTSFNKLPKELKESATPRNIKTLLKGHLTSHMVDYIR